MANCLGCGKRFGEKIVVVDPVGNEHETELESSMSKNPGLCPTCRRRLRVGELVEGMAPDSCLMKSETRVGYAFDPDMADAGAKWIYGETALEALEKGVKHG